MRAATITLAVLVFQSAPAESFEDRVKLAKAVEETEEYKKYEKIMFNGIGNHLAHTMRSCKKWLLWSQFPLPRFWFGNEELIVRRNSS